MANIIDVAVADDRWEDELVDASHGCRRAAEATLTAIGMERAGGFEVSIVLSDDRMVQGLNRKFRGIDKTTNVLSFPAEAKGTPRSRQQPLGDVVLAFQTVLAEAKAQGKSFSDHATHLVVHGVLHLLGRDHQMDGDAEAMEALEVQILRRLDVANPYRVSDPA
ncbi:MAG: rRNA maturation RNase YbeY [Alphaproteobacteria bacterium]|nr:rRNA maturation RNase YbeY [Alphaproteobacteria bacterium]